MQLIIKKHLFQSCSNNTFLLFAVQKLQNIEHVEIEKLIVNRKKNTWNTRLRKYKYSFLWEENMTKANINIDAKIR